MDVPAAAPTPPATAGAAIPEPSAATAPAPAAPAASAPGAASDAAIKPVVAKLFNTASSNIVVSFQVVKELNEVVTVFTDKTTGKEIVQFPSQQLIALAEFFSKLAGNVLDKTA